MGLGKGPAPLCTGRQRICQESLGPHQPSLWASRERPGVKTDSWKSGQPCLPLRAETPPIPQGDPPVNRVPVNGQQRLVLRLGPDPQAVLRPWSQSIPESTAKAWRFVLPPTPLHGHCPLPSVDCRAISQIYLTLPSFFPLTPFLCKHVSLFFPLPFFGCSTSP